MWTNTTRVIADSRQTGRFKVWTYRSQKRWRVAPDVLLGGVRVWDRQNLGNRMKRFSSLSAAFAAIELAEAVERGGEAA